MKQGGKGKPGAQKSRKSIKELKSRYRGMFTPAMDRMQVRQEGHVIDNVDEDVSGLVKDPL